MLVLIGLFKLAKALLLIAAGIGAIRLLHRDVPATVSHFVQVLRIEAEERLLAHDAGFAAFRAQTRFRLIPARLRCTSQRWQTDREHPAGAGSRGPNGQRRSADGCRRSSITIESRARSSIPEIPSSEIPGAESVG